MEAIDPRVDPGPALAAAGAVLADTDQGPAAGRRIERQRRAEQPAQLGEQPPEARHAHVDDHPAIERDLRPAQPL
jgi:hypothetical protein